jgi:hypothetical protein
MAQAASQREAGWTEVNARSLRASNDLKALFSWSLIINHNFLPTSEPIFNLQDAGEGKRLAHGRSLTMPKILQMNVSTSV